ncbi:MAG TPA: 2OG-Fe(II) oxygenase [Chitinophagales bacterium]|nr:2OG-Fe(II) oxygenase [Chitinophagales bacterium]
MQAIFDTLIDSYIADKVGIADNFLSVALSGSLKQNLLSLYGNDQLHSAGTGNQLIVLQDKLIRSDKIYWLDAGHNNLHENNFFKLMDSFVTYLNATCYAGITGYEFHYTMYEKGSYYKKHLDQFRNDSSRAYSMIMYLNSDWQLSDGGELCIHHKDHTQNISPNNGKCVLFKSSELIHEVLLTQQPRLSITGWLKTG